MAITLEKKLFGSLPEELDPLGELELEGARFRLNVESRRYGKMVTIVTVDGWGKDQIKGLAQELKTQIGTGGTATETSVELQGDHVRRVKDILASKGFMIEG